MSKFIEPLEDRRMLSLVVDLRLPGGGKQVTVDSVGDQVNMEIWATATGDDATGANESLQIVDGSVLSTNINGGAVNGNLTASVIEPWTAGGATNAAQADLDGDGDLDAGSNDVTNATGFFFARADSLQSAGSTGVGTVSGASQTWQVGVATFTVTSLRKISAQTNIVYRPRDYISGALWREDGIAILKNGLTGTYLGGTPMVIKTSVGGPVDTGGISGQVFTDTDGSGTKNGSESGRAAVAVFLDSDKDGILDAGEPNTSTDGSGNYTFSSLAEGSYRVRAIAPAGFHVTAPAGGFSDVTVGTSAITGKNFGVQENVTTGGSIAGKVWNDTDGDSVIDASETGHNGVTLWLDADKDGVLDAGEKSTTSDSSGNFKFSGLAAASYRVRLSPVGGFHLTAPAAGYYDVTVATNAAVTGKNFGLKADSGTTGSISGKVFSDANKNGAFDSGDTLLSARKIFIDANSNGVLDSGEKSTTSNSSGVYTFSGLAAGNYRLRRADLPTGYFNTVPAAGFYDIALAAAQAVTGKDFGAATGTGGGNTASITGKIFSDANKNGVFDSGDTLLSARKIFIDANSNGTLDSGEKSVTSNASGVYAFTGLAAGNYRIRRADLPTGYFNTVPAAGFYDIALAAAQAVTGKDFGAASGTGGGGNTASISGKVYSDANKNGVFDTGDTLLSNRKMYIDNNKNGILDTGDVSVFSNSSGVFTFAGLAAGSYRIRRADLPTGYHLTSPAAGFFDITLSAGQTVTGKDFGAAPIENDEQTSDELIQQP